MKKNRRIILALLGILLVGFALTFFTLISNPWNAKCVGDIPCPVGYSRLECTDSYTSFLRELPLKKRGSLVHLYTGGVARLQFLSAGVVDMPVLSNSEQCADVAMRIRAEHLWNEGCYSEICFTSVGGKEQPYTGGNSREAFEKYMKAVYGACNTSSVYHETEVRALKDVQPGDILVYPSRRKGTYGHAIMIADVAKSKSGKLAILCIEGNTPAREAHIVRNPNTFRNPWFVLKGDEKVINIFVFRFNKEELRHY